VIHVKKILLAALAATMLSGCIFDEEFWEDDYDSGYDSPAGDDCDCEEEYFRLVPSDRVKPLEARPR
jgi:hypothetical protein